MSILTPIVPTPGRVMSLYNGILRDMNTAEHGCQYIVLLVHYPRTRSGSPLRGEDRAVTLGRPDRQGNRQYATVIDIIVLEMAFAREPWIAKKVRTVTVLGPSPAPPWVVHRSVPYKMQEVLRREFLSVHTRQEGRGILEAAGISRFACVSDENYDAIRKMERVAATVEW